MISQGTVEWKLMLQKFELARNKSNKYSICIDCWKIYRIKLKGDTKK